MANVSVIEIQNWWKWSDMSVTYTNIARHIRWEVSKTNKEKNEKLSNEFEREQYTQRAPTANDTNCVLILLACVANI